MSSFATSKLQLGALRRGVMSSKTRRSLLGVEGWFAGKEERRKENGDVEG